MISSKDVWKLIWLQRRMDLASEFTYVHGKPLQYVSTFLSEQSTTLSIFATPFRHLTTSNPSVFRTQKSVGHHLG